MTARTETNALQHRVFARTGISLSFDDANTLRRAEISLGRWGEAMCNGYVQRDENTGKPYGINRMIAGSVERRFQVADREAGALRRIADVCKRNGLHYYHQTDPRGCSLYVSNEPLPDNNYSRGVSCCA